MALSNELKIRTFTKRDVDDASRLAFNAWMHEDLPEYRAELGEVIFGYMVRYYARSEHYSRAASLDGARLDSFLLAYRPDDETDADVWFESALGVLTPTEQAVAQQYRSYLKAQTKHLLSVVQGHFLIAGLFVSQQKGAGTPLMGALLEQCQSEGYESLYLWADTTCNVGYYVKRGFDIVARFDDCEFVDGKRFDIIVFRKCFSKH